MNAVTCDEVHHPPWCDCCAFPAILLGMRSTDPKLAVLRSVDLLEDVPASRLASLAMQADEVDVRAGTVLIRQGRLNRHAYLVVSGTLSVEVDGSPVALVGPGSIVGERSALHREPTNATVVVAEDATVLAVDHRALLGAMSDVPSFGDRIRSITAERDAARDAA